MTRIRLPGTRTVTLSASTHVTEAIPFSSFAGGVVHMPAAWTSASIGFKVSSTADGTFVALYNSSGSLVQIASPSASLAYTLPDTVFPCRFIKLWSQDGAGADEAQAAARTIVIDLKA